MVSLKNYNKEMMEQIINSNTPAMSEDIRAFGVAFLQAKIGFIELELNGKNNHTRKKYPLLRDIYKAVEKGLATHSIFITHFSRPQETGMEYLYTRLIHTLSGQFIEDCRIVESEKPGNQAKGAANTYMKRYAVLALCSISPDDHEDDDSQSEEEHASKNESLISEEQVVYLLEEIKSASNGAILFNNIRKFNEIQEFNNLRASKFESVKSYIAKNRK